MDSLFAHVFGVEGCFNGAFHKVIVGIFDNLNRKIYYEHSSESYGAPDERTQGKDKVSLLRAVLSEVEKPFDAKQEDEQCHDVSVFEYLLGSERRMMYGRNVLNLNAAH